MVYMKYEYITYITIYYIGTIIVTVQNMAVPRGRRYTPPLSQEISLHLASKFLGELVKKSMNFCFCLFGII